MNKAIDDLVKVLESEPKPEDRPAVKVEKLDFDPFGVPVNPNIAYITPDSRFTLLPTFFSLTSTDLSYAAELLREELSYLKTLPGVKVYAYLAPPSSIQILSYPTPGEKPDTTMGCTRTAS